MGPADEMWRERRIGRIDDGRFEGMDMSLTQRGGSEKVAARSREHCPTQRFRGANKGSRVGSGVGKASDVHFLRGKSQRVMAKAEDDKWMAWKDTVPFKMFSGQLPFVAARDLICDGKRKEVGSRAIRETHNEEEAPVSIVSWCATCQLVAS